MPTTVGSTAFEKTTAECNAPVVDRLLDAGLIILAKTNLTEFCGVVNPAVIPGGHLSVGKPYRAIPKVELKKMRLSSGTPLLAVPLRIQHWL